MIKRMKYFYERMANDWHSSPPAVTLKEMGNYTPTVEFDLLKGGSYTNTGEWDEAYLSPKDLRKMACHLLQAACWLEEAQLQLATVELSTLQKDPR